MIREAQEAFERGDSDATGIASFTSKKGDAGARLGAAADPPTPDPRRFITLSHF